MKEIIDKKILENIQISIRSNLYEAIKKMNDVALQILFVVDNDMKIIGTITDGDIRRGLINNLTMDSPVSRFFNSNPKTIEKDITASARKVMVDYGINKVPLIDSNGLLLKVFSYEGISDTIDKLYSNKVVIMAGGKGVRLKPITDIIPKPLLPIHGKPIIYQIMHLFTKYGFSSFVFTLNYKKEMIKLYLDSISKELQDFSLIEEVEFLGTAGALSLLSPKEDKAVFLTNCDILLDIDYGKVLEYHNDNNNDITIVSNLQEISVPYGVLKQSNGTFIDIEEKPTLHYNVNTGIYVLSPSVIERIPYSKRIDMPDVIKNEKTLGSRIGIYPTHEKWFDIGNWTDLQKNS